LVTDALSKFNTGMLPWQPAGNNTLSDRSLNLNAI